MAHSNNKSVCYIEIYHWVLWFMFNFYFYSKFWFIIIVILLLSCKTAMRFWWHAHHFSFIERYGTHIIVGVKMGGKDVIYVKQKHSSTLQPADVQKRLKEMADKRFLDANGQYSLSSEQLYQNDKVCDKLFYNLCVVIDLVSDCCMSLHVYLIGYIKYCCLIELFLLFGRFYNGWKTLNNCKIYNLFSSYFPFWYLFAIG